MSGYIYTESSYEQGIKALGLCFIQSSGFFFYISFRSYKYIYIDFQLDQNVTLRYFSIMRQWRDVEVRFGEIFVSCNQILGHHSEFLYVQELKMSMTSSEITWYDEMFYWDLMRYLCFVMRYHVIWWDKGTSIYWYLVFIATYFMYYMYVSIDNIHLCLYWIPSFFVCCFEFINHLHVYTS